MPYLCLKCYKVIEESTVKKSETIKYTDKMGYYHPCPHIGCGGEVVWIDELLVPTIVKLNQKGYKTKYSCSGHSYQNNPNCYIMFANKPPTVPKGFKDEGKLFRKIFREHGTSLFKAINQTAVELLEWGTSCLERKINKWKIIK